MLNFKALLLAIFAGIKQNLKYKVPEEHDETQHTVMVNSFC